jgi:hypothetical protein
MYLRFFPLKKWTKLRTKFLLFDSEFELSEMLALIKTQNVCQSIFFVGGNVNPRPPIIMEEIYSCGVYFLCIDL